MSGLPEPPEGALVVSLRAPKLYVIGFPLALVFISVAFWIAGGTRWQAIVYSVFMGAFLLYWLAIVIGGRGRRGSWEERLVLTDEGVSTSMFSLDWDDVDRITIGQPGRRRALTIEPVRWERVRWADSRFVRLNAWMMARTPGIKILDANLERSVFDLARQMEEKAGRTLFVDTGPGRLRPG